MIDLLFLTAGLVLSLALFIPSADAVVSSIREMIYDFSLINLAIVIAAFEIAAISGGGVCVFLLNIIFQFI